MAWIERDAQSTAARPETSDFRTPPATRRRWLGQGLTSAAVGLALLLALWTLGAGPWLAAGAVPLGYGLGLVGAIFPAKTK